MKNIGIKSKVNKEDLYLLNIIDMDYINLDKSYIDGDGYVHFNINVEKLPDKYGKTAREILSDNLFETTYNYAYHHGRSDQKGCEPDETTEYYILYDPTPTTGFLSTELFEIGHGLTHCKAYDSPIGETMRNLKLVNDGLYTKIQNALDKFNTEANNWTRKTIRETLFDDNAVGTFHNDNIMDYTYIQQRKQGDSYVYYILWKWWQYNFPEEIIWEEVKEGSNIFIALNDD